MAYVMALGGFGANGLGSSGVNNLGTTWYTNGALSFDGIPIFMANGMASNQGLATTTSNLHFATGLLSDLNEVRVIDTSETLGDQNVRVIMRFLADAKVGFAADCVTYGIINNAN